MRKIIIGVVALAIIAGLVWAFFPGLRPKIREAYENYGGWTEEARRDDPVGFIEYAQKKLGEDLRAFERSRGTLANAKKRAGDELDRSTKRLAQAGELALKFRESFQSSEASSSYPADVMGKPYTREELVSQVKLILAQKGTYEESIGSYEKILATISERELEVLRRIQSTKATLTSLEARKELERIKQLTGETEALLGQVNELLEENEESLGGMETPVRTVEELLAASSKADETSAGDAIDALEFLKSE